MENDQTITQDVTAAITPTESKAQGQTEVRPTRRRFTQAEKITILEELDACERGLKGVYLRQRGLYSSVVYGWRKDLQAGAGLQPKKRGTKPQSCRDRAAEVVKLRRQLARAEELNRQMQIIIDVQKKVSQILGVTLPEEAQ